MGFKQCLPYSEEYFEDILGDIQHQYQLYYIIGDKSYMSKAYEYYQYAFDDAIKFADKILKTDLPNDIKVKVINSLHVIDCDENRDVMTVELKDILLKKIEGLR